MDQKQCQNSILAYSISDLIQIIPCDLSHYELRPVPSNLKTSFYTRGTQCITKIISPKTKIIPLLVEVPNKYNCRNNDVGVCTNQVLYFERVYYVVELSVKRTDFEMYTIIFIYIEDCLHRSFQYFRRQPTSFSIF